MVGAELCSPATGSFETVRGCLPLSLATRPELLCVEACWARERSSSQVENDVSLETTMSAATQPVLSSSPQAQGGAAAASLAPNLPVLTQLEGHLLPALQRIEQLATRAFAL